MQAKSPYTAAITGGGLLFEETNVMLPLLLSPDRTTLVKDEVSNNRLLRINAEKSRYRAVAEIGRRFDAMPSSFWQDYLLMNEEERRVALLLVMLKTYKILFDFHINVTLRRWNSISKSVCIDDLMMEFNEISARDEFVDSWSDNTKDRVASAYLSVLRKVGMLDRANRLSAIKSTNMDYYLTHGEAWFLEACLLQPYQIEQIRKEAMS
ncbi:MAG: DUF1819 family protein [Bacteroidales bacterium]|nr:DUF1819 family protein [Bacteroidales bacterium]